ncbi:hypothetical protein JXO59_10510 [candidate division KSB1 bacterium]|nr:hypothetical protein [candidate division KSB1 bacterium]
MSQRGKKWTYSKPVLTPLGGSETSYGVCENGSGNIGGYCKNGNNAGYGVCQTGTAAGGLQGCQNGIDAANVCSTGSSGA